MRCEKHRVPLKRVKVHGKYQYRCPISHKKLPKDPPPPEHRCPNCGAKMKTAMQHYYSCNT